jgi:hypothetical protein
MMSQQEQKIPQSFDRFIGFLGRNRISVSCPIFLHGSLPLLLWQGKAMSVEACLLLPEHELNQIKNPLIHARGIRVAQQPHCLFQLLNALL